MEFFNWFMDLVLHLDDHLLELTTQYGTWVYAILFAIIFPETGLVVTPFLPGDSLLFAVGSLTALGALDLVTVLVLLTVAAVLGDTVNYWIGAPVGPKVFTQKHSRFFKKEHLDKTHDFYEGEEPVTVEMVVGNLMKNASMAKQIVRLVAEALDPVEDCACHHALANAIMTNPKAMPATTRKKLDVLIGKYMPARRGKRG